MKSWNEWLAEAKKNVDEHGCWNVAPHPNGDRRHCFYEYKGKRVLALAKIVYLEFVGEIPDELLVCHSCHNQNCLNVQHLFLGTHKDNAQSSVDAGWPNGQPQHKQKLTEEQVLQMRAEYAAGNTTHRQLSAKYNVSTRTTRGVIHRKVWKHI